MNNHQQRLTEINASRPFLEAKKLAAYKTDALTSKMWILPDGDIVSLDSWHYRWILANPKRVAKFGLDTTTLPDDEQSVRIAAIKRGFFRVNYEHRAGQLVIEGCRSRYGRDVKNAVFKIFIDNLKMIDRAKITLVDDAVKKVLSNKEVVLFNLRSDEDKMDQIDTIL